MTHNERGRMKSKTEATFSTVTFSAEILNRGFWLYVWEIETQQNDKFYYVGRTGDNSSANAAAPYTRMSQHLGKNKNQNALARHLLKKGITPKTLNFHSYGPIYQEQSSMDEHLIFRNKIAAYERKLYELLNDDFHLKVLNVVKCNFELDRIGWRPIENVFREKFYLER